MSTLALFRHFPTSRPLRAAVGHGARRAGLRTALRGSLLPLAAGLLALVLAGAATAQVSASTGPLQFRDAAEAQRFHALTQELRCVKCQNQSLADSNAQIALDLRREVLELMREGRSDEQVKQFLVDRYGEFVLYRPRVESTTWLLWFGPAVLLLAGAAVIAGLVRRRGAAPPPAADDEQEW